ncbi:MAG: MFS transporter [Deltaproteobacteria bacterium]|nr:MFS transporter [Deltaproteobacteria bacterium]MBW2414385.1 MFS transporter [Deltaproteobacteria bacterium]
MPSSPDERVRRPWWTFAVPYPGKMPELARKQWSVMGLLAAAELFDHYDMAIMGLALSQIQAELAIPESQVAGVNAVIRLGMLLSFGLTIMADRLGRRRILLATIVGFTLCTLGTAFVRDASEFMLLQFLARVFIGGETMLAVVVIAEELNAEDRGFGIGLLGALGALGHGVAALAFGFVEILPFGWRALYALGVIPLLFLAWFRRGLPETQRFESHSQTLQTQRFRDRLQPAFHLVRMYPKRMGVLCAAILPFDFVVASAFTFMPKTLQEVHGYSPGNVTVLFLTAGGLGILGNIYAGILGDRFGRKPVMCAGMVLNAVAIVGFYNASGWMLPPLWVMAVFTITGVGVLFKALGSELFPTSYRSTASGMRAVVGTLGGVAGLALEGPLYQLVGSHALAITCMAPVLVLPPILIATLLPETASRELEDISPERAADGR